jgi:hypothetical protein
MGFFKRFVLILLTFTPLMAVDIAAADPGGMISGTLGIQLPDGTAAHGDWIRVLLTTGPVPVPTGHIPSGLPAIARKDRINDLHLNFFVNVRKQMADPGFVVASTLTTDDGHFRFTEVAPGDYQTLVTFPAVIAGAKVAWQVPVRVAENERVTLVLDRENLALPVHLK